MEKEDVQFSLWTVLSELVNKEGTLSLKDLDSLPAIAYNGDKKCDVLYGPCSCGAFHSLTEERNFTLLGIALIEKYKGDN